MKQTKHFLRPLLMAIVMMVISPTRAWAQDIAAHLSISGRDAAVNFNGDPTTEPISSTVYLYEGEQVTVYLDVTDGPSVACFPVGNTTIGESGLSELALSDTNEGKFTVTTEGQYTFTLSNGSVGVHEQFEDMYDENCDYVGQTFIGYQVTNANVTLGVVYQSHTHVYDQEVVKDEALITAPTCTTKGSYYCSCICGELSREQTFEVPSLGHHLVRSNILASAATCIKDAEYKAMCDREGCDFVSETMTFTAYSTAFGHQWADSGDGEHHACQREGCEVQEAHSWHSGECVVCQATDPNFVEVNIVDSSGGFYNEEPANLFDGAPSTKWCSEGDPYADSEEVQFYVIFYPNKPYVLTSYTLVDAGDSNEHQNRKWSSWRIEGTNDLDSETWEDVDSRDGDYSNKTFTTGCTSVYAYYKLSVFASGFEEPENEYGGARLIQQMADMNITWSCVHQWGEDGKCTVCGMDECNLSGHDYQVQLDENKKPVFVWSEDYTTATLQLVCSHNAEHTANVEVTGEDITSEDTTPATCTTAGVRIYTATATYKDETYTGTKEVEISIDPDAHDYQVQLDEDDNPVFVWSEDYSTATLQVVCSHNAEHTANVEVTGEDITSAVTTPATCTTAGVRTYTATATYEGDTYTGTKEVEIPATGHSFDEETDPDHTHCTACDHWWTYYTTTGEDIAGIEERVGAVAHYFKEGNGYFETEAALTSIEKNAFNQCETLKSISLPFVTKIEDGAFSDCRALIEVNAPEATTIGKDAFSTDIALTSIYLPKATTIGDYAFEGCAMTSLALPAVTSIGSQALNECENLTELTLPCNFDLDRESVGLGENESVTISRVHKGESVAIEGVPATCTEDGYEAYEGCSVCLEPFGEKTVILALGHTPVTDEAVPATCTESGLTEGSHCSVCGDLLVLQEETPALGHTLVTDKAVPATCTESGLTEGLHCSVCDEVLVVQEEIPALDHDFKDQVIAENQGEDGYYHYGCSRCDELDSNYSFAKMFGKFREATDDEAPTETIQLTKVGNYYYASLYTDFPYVVGGDDVAYYVTSAENGVVTLDNTANVRAGSGVIFRSENSECTIEYDPEGFENTAPEDNLLTGSDEAFVPNANQYAFGLSNEGFLGFWRWPNMTIPAWKAYLELDEETAARGFRIVFDDETNGIQQLPADASAIEGSYDLMGHKVREVKGLGIVNGKKVFVNY